MVRNLANLSRHTYDVLVIGGGIYGVCIAWDAALRGLSVALVEKGDFGHATSANSLRVIHGGLRYLQHGNVRRVRRSIEERAAFMRIAPHLVHPLPILLPTYGHGLHGKEILSLAVMVNQFIGWQRDGAGSAANQLLEGRAISKQECLRLFPGVRETGLTGGMIVYDCQMSNSERLVLSFAHSASEAGAEMANYVEAVELIVSNGLTGGVKARDILTGDELTVRAKTVVNAAGPWVDIVAAVLTGRARRGTPSLSKAFNLLLNRKLISDNAVGVYSRGSFKDRDAILDKGSRLLFITPWQQRSLIGTAHLPYYGDPGDFQITAMEVQDFIDEINDAYPAARLGPEDVEHVYGGLLPADDDQGVQLLRQHQLCDHQKEDGIDGFISVKGVKFTEARYVAEKTVDAVFRKMGKKAPRSMTATTPIYGGQTSHFNMFSTDETRQTSEVMDTNFTKLLISHYGSACGRVLKHGVTSDETGNTALDPVRAEVLHGIREEMAVKLADIVFRRTTVGLPGRLNERTLQHCATPMAQELGWSEERVRREVAEVRACLPLGTLATDEAA